MTDLAVKTVDLAKRFGRVKALDGLSLEVPKGVIYGIIGPNGAGKTTLFSVLCGYLAADSGQALLHGRAVKPAHRLPVALSTFPQDARMHDQSTVAKHLVYYARLQGFRGEAAVNEASRVLHLVKLPDAWGRSPRVLSHGMRKRVGLAQAFIGNPEIIILDEPVAGLDPESARQVRAAIREAATDRTVLISSHDLDQVQDLCSDVALIEKGQVVRTQHVADLISAGGHVAFKLTAAPPDTVVRAIEALPFVTSARWDPVDARLRIECETTDAPLDTSSSQLVQLLVEKGVAFSDMQVGRRLADVVRDAAGSS